MHHTPGYRCPRGREERERRKLAKQTADEIRDLDRSEVLLLRELVDRALGIPTIGDEDREENAWRAWFADAQRIRSRTLGDERAAADLARQAGVPDGYLNERKAT